VLVQQVKETMAVAEPMLVVAVEALEVKVVRDMAEVQAIQI
jgi:hypothetical protein